MGRGHGLKINSAYFDVERRLEGAAFASIGAVATADATGTTWCSHWYPSGRVRGARSRPAPVHGVGY